MISVVKRFSTTNKRAILPIVLLLVSVTLTLPGPLAAQEKLDQIRMEETYRLLLNGVKMPELEALRNHPDPEYVEREWEGVAEVQRQRTLEEIRIQPGLKPYLFAVLEKQYRTDPTEWVVRILEAIASRDDLTAEDVERIKPEMIKGLHTPKDPYYNVASFYVRGAIAVLARDLTEENEALITQALADYPFSGANMDAARVLVDAGVTRALPALQKAIDRQKEANPEAASTRILQKEKDRLEAKFAAGEVLTPEGRKLRILSPISSPVPSGSPPVAPADSNHEMLIWLIAAVAIAGGTWLVFRKMQS